MLACSLAIAACRLNGSPGQHPRGGVVVGQPGGVRLQLHVGDLELDRLVVADRLAEGVALLRVLDRLVDAALGEADGQGGDGDPALVEDPQELGEAPAPLAEQVRRRHPAVVEGQLVGVRGGPADLGVGRRDGEARRTGRHDDRWTAPCEPSGRVPVTAVTVTSAVMSVPELVMNAFEPLITHSSPSSTARVWVPPASEPVPGSVSPKAASASPLSSLGSQVRLLLLEYRSGRSASRPARPPPPG